MSFKFMIYSTETRGYAWNHKRSEFVKEEFGTRFETLDEAKEVATGEFCTRRHENEKI